MMLEGGNEREQRGGKEFFHEGVLKGEKNPAYVFKSLQLKMGSFTLFLNAKLMREKYNSVCITNH